MPSPHEKLADALEKLSQAETRGILRHDSISRTYRERLLQMGFISEIIRGWYYTSNPESQSGETSWYAFYWEFLRQYLESRFGSEYCLSADASLLLHGASNTIPSQIVVISKTGGSFKVGLPGGLSLFIYPDKQGFPTTMDNARSLNIMSLPEALTRVGEGFFVNFTSDASIALSTISDPSAILQILLDQGRSTVASRLVGAFNANHQPEIADQVRSTMRRAGFDVRNTNPFDRPIPQITTKRNASPYEIRLRSMWANMREAVIGIFPPSPGLPSSVEGYLRTVDEVYVNDAYNSLSIEGYRVSRELVERVRTGNWNPDTSESDRQSRDALAARGYYEAFQLVRGTVSRLVQGESPETIRKDHRDWYQALFGPSVVAGILKPADLAGYRNHPVFINGSHHVPPPSEGVVDGMATLFDLIAGEPEASVRAVLGHFMFVFVHPYGDGNGRLGRFLMNTMLASGGFPWTVIHLERRPEYMTALESASVDGDIQPFAHFVASDIINQYRLTS